MVHPETIRRQLLMLDVGIQVSPKSSNYYKVYIEDESTLFYKKGPADLYIPIGCNTVINLNDYTELLNEKRPIHITIRTNISKLILINSVKIVDASSYDLQDEGEFLTIENKDMEITHTYLEITTSSQTNIILNGKFDFLKLGTGVVISFDNSEYVVNTFHRSVNYKDMCSEIYLCKFDLLEVNEGMFYSCCIGVSLIEFQERCRRLHSNYNVIITDCIMQDNQQFIISAKSLTLSELLRQIFIVVPLKIYNQHITLYRCDYIDDV